MSNNLHTKVFQVTNLNFNQLALEIFRYQAESNPIFKNYLRLIDIRPTSITHSDQIPFLPIELFKKHRVISGKWEKPENVFYSSGTTGKNRSKHYIKDMSYYRQVVLKIFARQYGSPEDYHIFAVMPSPIENPNSSLIQMCDFLTKASNSQLSGFYYPDFNELLNKVEVAKNDFRKIIIIGVSFALLDLADSVKSGSNLKDCVIIETGGMKGKREEITRIDLHNRLKERFKVKSIHSEYGMAELLSHAYASENGRFLPPGWMKIIVRDIYNPFLRVTFSRMGGINVMDLANIDTCSFIETQDMGILHKNGEFEIIGRIDNSEIRGCNLLIG